MSFPWFATSKVLAAGGAAARATTFPSSKTIRYPTVRSSQKKLISQKTFLIAILQFIARHQIAKSTIVGARYNEYNRIANIRSATTKRFIGTVSI